MATTHHERQVGRRLRDLLLRRVEERMAEPGYAESLGMAYMDSSLSAPVRPYVRVDNIDFVHIYQAPLGGWHADIHLKKVPPGVMNTLGTAVDNPCRTREDALEAAEFILEFVIVLERQAPLPKANPVFMFHDYRMELFPEVLEQLAAIGARYENQDHAIQRIEEMQARIFPNGIPAGKMELPGPVMAEVMTVLHMAAMTAVLRYPPLEPAIINT